jgi:hypothetical protein
VHTTDRHGHVHYGLADHGTAPKLQGRAINQLALGTVGENSIQLVFRVPPQTVTRDVASAVDQSDPPAVCMGALRVVNRMRCDR